MEKHIDDKSKGKKPINRAETQASAENVNQVYGDGSPENKVIIYRGAKYAIDEHGKPKWTWNSSDYNDVKPASLVRVFWLQMKLLEGKNP